MTRGTSGQPRLLIALAAFAVTLGHAPAGAAGGAAAMPAATAAGTSSRAPAFIVLDRSRLNFGAVQGGVGTGPQDVLITNNGDVALDWTAAADQPWISLSRDSGIGSYVVTVEADATGLSTGTYQGAVTVSDPAAANSPRTLPVRLEVVAPGSTSPPFGSFETPADGATVAGNVPFVGWALDDIEVSWVRLYLQDGGLLHLADALFVAGARPDIVSFFPDLPRNDEAGWGVSLLTYFLPGGGNGTYTFVVRAADAEGQEVTLGTRTVTVDNASAVDPFGSIDTPQPGGVVAGTSFTIFGWALTPQPNTIPADGSTIELFLDGVSLGHATYNQYRADIAGLLPGYANSDGAGFFLTFDTTEHDNGLHSLHAMVTDSAGNSEGLGGRLFTIYNPGNQVPVELLHFSVE